MLTKNFFCRPDFGPKSVEKIPLDKILLNFGPRLKHPPKLVLKEMPFDNLTNSVLFKHLNKLVIWPKMIVVIETLGQIFGLKLARLGHLAK